MKVQATAIEAIKIINNLHLGCETRKLPPPAEEMFYIIHKPIHRLVKPSLKKNSSINVQRNRTRLYVRYRRLYLGNESLAFRGIYMESANSSSFAARAKPNTLEKKKETATSRERATQE